MNLTPQKYRKNVGIIIIHAGKILFCRRKSCYQDGEAWQLPQGGVDGDEELEQAVHREIHEETGMTGASILGRTADYIYYEWPAGIPRTRPNNDYIGQRQIYFVVEVTAEALNDIQESEEFDAFAWVSVEYILENIVSFKRPVYQQVFEELKHLLP